MEISKTLQSAIESGRKSSIYSIFYTIAHEDPNFSSGKFRNTLNFVKEKNIHGLMEIYDGKPFAPEYEWSQDYWAEVASDLIDNFCDERIDHLEKVGKKVYPRVEKKETITSESTQNVKKKGDVTKTKIQIEESTNVGILVGIVVVIVIVVLLLILNR